MTHSPNDDMRMRKRTKKGELRPVVSTAKILKAIEMLEKANVPSDLYFFGHRKPQRKRKAKEHERRRD